MVAYQASEWENLLGTVHLLCYRQPILRVVKTKVWPKIDKKLKWIVLSLAIFYGQLDCIVIFVRVLFMFYKNMKFSAAIFFIRVIACIYVWM